MNSHKRIPEKRLVEMYGGEIRLFADGGELLAPGSDGVDLILLDISLNREAECGGTGQYGAARKIRKVGCTDYLRDGQHVNMCLKAMM